MNCNDTYYIPGMHTSLAPYLVVPPSFGNKLSLALTNTFAPFAKVALVDQSNSGTSSYYALLDFSDVSNGESRLGRGNIHISESANENEHTFDGMIINVQVPNPEECIKLALTHENIKRIGHSLLKFMMSESEGVTIQIQKLDGSNPVVHAVICCENDEECEKLQKEIINLNEEFIPSVLIQGDQSIRAVRGPEFGLVAFAVSQDEQCKKKMGGIKAFVKKIDEPSSLSLFGQSVTNKTLLNKVVVCLSKFNGNVNSPNKESHLYASEMSRYAKLINSSDHATLTNSNGMRIVPVIITDNSSKIVNFLTTALDGEVKIKASNGSWLIGFGPNSDFNGFVEVREATKELPSNSISVSICVPDLDKSFEKVKQYSNDIKVEYSPRDCEWGENMAIFVYDSMQITLAQFHGTFKGAFVDSDYSKWCNGHDTELNESKKSERIPYAPRGDGKIIVTLETNENIRKCSPFFNNHVFGGKGKVIIEVKKQPSNAEGTEHEQVEKDALIKEKDDSDDDLELIVLTSKEEDDAIIIKKKGDIKANDQSQMFQNPRLIKYLVKDAADFYEKLKSQVGITSTINENGNGEQSFTFMDPTGNHSIFSSISSRLNFSNISKAAEMSVANDLTIVNDEEQIFSLLDESSTSTGSTKRSVDEAERNCEGEDSFESLTKKSKSILTN